MKYDAINAVLTVDDIEQVECGNIRSWVDNNIAKVLSNKDVIFKSYRTGEITVNITIVCHGYVVGVYDLNSDELYIQSVGFENAKRKEYTSNFTK